MKTLSRVSLIAIATSACLPAYSQIQNAEDSPAVQDTVVVTTTAGAFGATKIDAPILETARSLTIETSELFEEKGAVNLSQTTSYMAGVTAETFGFATRGDWITIRGLDAPRYRDSIQELFGSYNTTRADTFTLEQVEVLKGPASVLYGQGSPGGIVNYVSKTPKEEFGGEVAAQLGNFDRYQIAADVTGPIDGTNLAYRLVGLYRDTGSQIDNVDEKTMVFMPSLSWTPSDDTKFTIIGMYQDTDSDTGSQFIPIEGTLEPLTNGGFIDQDVYAGEPGFNKFNTDSTQLTFLGEHRINEVFKLEATALWRKGEADYHQAWPIFAGAGVSRYLNNMAVAFGLVPPGVQLATDTTVARSFYQADNEFEQYAGDIRLRADFNTGPLEHQILTGVQYQNVETDNNFAYYYGGGALSGDFSFALDLANPVYTGAPDQSVFDAIYVDSPTQEVNDWGLYISDQISIDNWRITLGIRSDNVENDTGTIVQDDDAISTSFGLLYAFDNGISPYFSYAESFETVVGTTLDGSQLDPEEGEQIEFGLKYEPKSVPGFVSLAYYEIDISNLPNPNSLPADAAQQQGISKLKGWEAEAKLELGDFFIQAAASTSDSKDPDGYHLSAQPDSHASIWTTWRPSQYLRGLKAGLGIRHVGESISENSVLQYKTPNYTLGDLMVGYEWDKVDLQLNVRNLTDEEYLTSCLTRGDCFPGVRRTAVASLKYKF